MKFIVFLNSEGTHTLPDDIERLPSVELDATADDFVMDVAARAESESGVAVQHGRLLFVDVPNEQGVRSLTGFGSAIVKSDGLMHWLGYPRNDAVIQVGDLERSKSEGFFEGDPRAVVLDRPTVGNGAILQTWEGLAKWLTEVGDVWGGLTALGAVVYGLRRLVRKAKSPADPRKGAAARAAWLRGFLETHESQWSSRGADPFHFFVEFLRRESWQSDHLRRLLNIDLSDVHRLLDAFGYVYDPAAKAHVLTSDANRLLLRGALIEEFLKHDPTEGH